MMDEIKIKNFAAAHPNTDLPDVRHLEPEECKFLQGALATRIGLGGASTGLEILRALELKASDIPGVQPSPDDFVLADLLKQLHVEAGRIFVNWSRFDDIDEMNAQEFSAIFHDLWYPSSDDIELFDRSLNWVLFIRHFDVVQFARI